MSGHQARKWHGLISALKFSYQGCHPMQWLMYPLFYRFIYRSWGNTQIFALILPYFKGLWWGKGQIFFLILQVCIELFHRILNCSVGTIQNKPFQWMLMQEMIDDCRHNILIVFYGIVGMRINFNTICNNIWKTSFPISNVRYYNHPHYDTKHINTFYRIRL